MNTIDDFSGNTANWLIRFRGWHSNEDCNKVLDALRTEKLYFSTALGYNDPYDTLMYVDYEKLFWRITSSWSDMDQYIERLREKNLEKAAFAQLITSPENPHFRDLQIRFLYYVANEVDMLKRKLRENIKGICFSTDMETNLMWAHYACNHSGIALCYDRLDLTQKPCYSSSRKEIKNRFVLEPIHYCDKRPDATDFIEAYVMEIIRNQSRQGDADVVTDWPPVRIQTVKDIILTKDASWSYEQEVRLIPRNMEFEIPKDIQYMKIKPRAIILGAKMDERCREEVVRIAQSLGDVALYRAMLNDGQSGYKVNIQEYI